MTKDDTVLTMYLREINKISLLTREEENELALKAKAGDVVAKGYWYGCLPELLLTKGPILVNLPIEAFNLQWWEIYEPKPKLPVK